MRGKGECDRRAQWRGKRTAGWQSPLEMGGAGVARGRPSRATQYARLDSAITQLRQRLGGLPSPAASPGTGSPDASPDAGPPNAWPDLWHLESHHSTALAGNSLLLREVEVLLEKGRAVGGKPLRDYLEVQGYGAAARWVHEQASPDGQRPQRLISVEEIRLIHSLAMSLAWQVAPHPDATAREAPGMFREHDLPPSGTGMTPPGWQQVPGRVRDWAEQVNAVAGQLAGQGGGGPLPEDLARLHASFAEARPFIDGNGRAGRLALNVIAVRLGYPPAIVVRAQRAAYLAALQAAGDGDYGPLGEIVARALNDSVSRFLIPSLAGPARLVPLATLAGHGFSLSALRQAAQRGRLDAVQGPDGIWLASRAAVEAYRRARPARQPRKAGERQWAALH